MRRLKQPSDEGNIYEQIIKVAEQDMVEEKMSGHEAAKMILNSIFS